ncbi:hypothetical protein WA026_023285 [Henosepilachna vigintioctopunctata]|uniref:Uncharacterized protein n=1 Tax=Henosepilachna vigintioctopunctata TaxID=420089 RepID=A0AAW1UDI6_9CUCU
MADSNIDARPLKVAQRSKMIELINLNNLSSLMSASNKSKAIPTTMKLSNDVNITTNNENSINETAPNTAEQTWSTVATKKIPRRGNVNIVCTGVNNNTDLKKNGTKGAIRKRWVYVGRVSGNEVSESDIWIIFRSLKQSI